jgi:hypothetical protein
MRRLYRLALQERLEPLEVLLTLIISYEDGMTKLHMSPNGNKTHNPAALALGGPVIGLAWDIKSLAGRSAL